MSQTNVTRDGIFKFLSEWWFVTVRPISWCVYSWVFKKEREGDIAYLKCYEGVQRKKIENGGWKCCFFFYSDEKVELMEVLRIRNSTNLMFLIYLFNSCKVSECLDLRLLKLLFVFIFYHQIFWSFVHFFTQVDYD